jgi:glycosyltransferase involved in cell wall biosynthesis
MTEQKNQNSILEIANRIKGQPETEDIHFLIVGSGPLENKLKATASQLGVEDSVTFTGYLPRREHIYSLLHKSDIFLVPSRYEGFCVAAVEAMACKLPVIANDIQVLREVVGDRGIFVSAEDSQRLAKRVTQTAAKLGTESMENRRRELYQRAITKFPLKRTATAYHELYFETCN